jgi:hypothetical protein
MYIRCGAVELFQAGLKEILKKHWKIQLLWLAAFLVILFPGLKTCPDLIGEFVFAWFGIYLADKVIGFVCYLACNINTSGIERTE